jgi:DNA segregation ATPase FtsK/SpoIIIE-like protein
MARDDDELEREDEFYDDEDEIDDDDEEVGVRRDRPAVRPFTYGESSRIAGVPPRPETPRSTSNLPGRGTTGGFSQRSDVGRPASENRFGGGSSSSSTPPARGGFQSGRPGTGNLRSPAESPAPDDKREPNRPPAGGFRSSSSERSTSPFSSSSSGDRGSSSSDRGSSSSYGGSSSSERGSSSFGSQRNTSPFSSSSASDRKPEEKSGSSGGGLGGRLGGLRSKLPGGGDKSSSKPAASRATSRPAASGSSGGGLGGALGNLRSKMPGGGDKQGHKPAASRPGASGSSGGGLGGALGNLRSKMPGGGGQADKGSSRSATPASGGFGSRASSAPGGSSMGQRGAPPGAGSARAADKPAASGGALGGIASRLPFGGQRDAGKARPATTREKLERASKAPKIDERGLSLDSKLDILGVVLLLGSLALFFSSMSTTKGQLTEAVNTFLSQLLGQGAIAVPIVMFAIGIWLVIRHFGDEAPVVDPVRVLGVGLLYIGALVLFQFLESFNPEYAAINLSNPSELRLQLYLSYNLGRGGGLLGSELYYLLVTNITEAGMLVVMIGLALLGMMLLLRISAAEVAIFFISLWRSFVASRQRRAQTREAKARMAAAQLAAAVDARTRAPEPAELPGGTAPALPAAAQAETQAEPRPIPITMGGRTVTAMFGQDGEAAAMPGQLAADAGDQPSIAARLFSAVPGLGRAAAKVEKPATPTPGPQQPPAPAVPPQIAPTQPTQGASSPGETTPAPRVSTPPQPARLGDLLNPAANLPAVSPAKEVTPAAESPATPSAPAQGAVEKPAATAPQEGGRSSVWARPTARPDQPASGADSLAERRERLNALRSGQTLPPTRSAEPPKREAPPPITGSASNRPTTPPFAPAASAQPASPSLPQRQSLNLSGNGAEKPTNGSTVTRQPAAAIPQAQPVSSPPPRKRRNWPLPDYRSLLHTGSDSDFDREILLKRARIIEETLQSFGAPGRVVEVNTGPVITQFGVEPDYLTTRSGKKNRVKVGAIAQLDKDLQLALGAKSIRIEAPVPGKGYVGIEVPNEEAALVSLRDVMESEQFKKLNAKSPLTIGLGQSVDGTPIAADLGVMPHLLVAGTTGSGKSVLVNAIICSLLINNTPDKVKFIMVDPKRVELTSYNGIPHLVAPVVVDLERTVGVLKWVTREMDERYKQFSNAGARNIEDFNKHVPAGRDPMPYIVVIIDELADLMMLAPDETERVVTRIAALARATGIHLVIATQRPSVDVVTGLIKANFPARIAFAVAGGVDSRVILDQPGAERLLGRGDMLYLSGNSPAPLRLQGVFVSDEEITNVTRYWKRQNSDQPEPHIIRSLVVDDEDEDDDDEVATTRTAPSYTPTTAAIGQEAFWDDGDDEDDIELHDRVKDERDELYEQAVDMVQRLNKASVSLLQRRLRIGYTRAARLIDMMEAEGIVGPQQEGSKPREVLKNMP